MTKLDHLIASFVICALALSFAFASDPDPLQDFCVATDGPKGVFVNGRFCKDPRHVKATDFTFTGLNNPGKPYNIFGSSTSRRSINNVPGLNTLGIYASRVDFAPNGGLSAPHSHPRASEIAYVAKGWLLVGYVTSVQTEYKLFTKILGPGQGIVTPQGMIHFQMNVGNESAVLFTGKNSQNPGTVIYPKALFRSNPRIDPTVLAKAFGISKNMVKQIESDLQPRS